MPGTATGRRRRSGTLPDAAAWTLSRDSSAYRLLGFAPAGGMTVPDCAQADELVATCSLSPWYPWCAAIVLHAETPRELVGLPAVVDAADLDRHGRVHVLLRRERVHRRPRCLAVGPASRSAGRSRKSPSPTSNRRSAGPASRDWRAVSSAYLSRRASAPISAVVGRPVEIAEPIVERRLQLEFPLAVEGDGSCRALVVSDLAISAWPGLKTINCISFSVSGSLSLVPVAAWDARPADASRRSKDPTTRPGRWRGRSTRSPCGAL